MNTGTAQTMTAAQPFLHPALLYRGGREYVAALVPFILAGLRAGEPVAVAVPGSRLRALRDRLRRAPAENGRPGTAADQVKWIDMTVAGRNPGRIIPGVLRAFVDGHPAAERIRIVGEPIWAGRSRVEYPACVHHEALINFAFTDHPVTILCPYDADELDPDVLADAAATHPTVIDLDGERTSAAYAPKRIIEWANQPLGREAAHSDLAELRFGTDNLAQAREFAAEHATRLGLAADRVLDLEVAVNELAANSLVHGGGQGVLRVWVEENQVLCQVRDRGHFTDPLAGRLPVGLGSDGGRGLLLVHHIADLVRIHAVPGDVTIRLHFSLGLGGSTGRPELTTPHAPCLSTNS